MLFSFNVIYELLTQQFHMFKKYTGRQLQFPDKYDKFPLDFCQSGDF